MIGSLAAVALATLVTLLVVSNDGGGGKRVTAGTSTTSSSSTTSSTSTSSTTSTTAPPATSTSAPAVSTTAAPPTTAVYPVVTGQGAVMHVPTTSDTRVVPPGSGCEALGDPGWTVTCGTTATRGAVLAWLIETRSDGSGTARRALVFQRGSGQQWSLRLDATDDAGTRFTDVRARVEDLSGDGVNEISFGFRRAGSSEVLAVDVVEGPANVVVHRELPKGVARVSTGQLDTWRRTDASHYAHDVIQFRDGVWRVVASASASSSEVPPSQL